MSYIEDILRMDNFKNLSQDKLIEIIMVLKDDLKYHKYKNNNTQVDIVNALSVKQSELINLQEQIKKYKEVINTYHKILKRPLTVKERLIGKIDLP